MRRWSCARCAGLGSDSTSVALGGAVRSRASASRNITFILSLSLSLPLSPFTGHIRRGPKGIDPLRSRGRCAGEGLLRRGLPEGDELDEESERLARERMVEADSDCAVVAHGVDWVLLAI